MFKIDIAKFEINCHVFFPRLGGTDIMDKLDTLIEKGASIMTTVAEINAAIEAEKMEVKARLDGLIAEVQALKDAAGTGVAVTEADLAGILDGIKGIFTPGGVLTPPVPGATTTDINGNIIASNGDIVNADGTVRYVAGTFTKDPAGDHRDAAGNIIYPV